MYGVVHNGNALKHFLELLHLHGDPTLCFCFVIIPFNYGSPLIITIKI